MPARAFPDLICSVARTAEVIGERWTVLVLREAFLGVRRFDDMQARLGIARNVLADRLVTLVDQGVLERRRYLERPERFEYRLTAKGRDLYPVIVAMLSWGDKHAPVADGPPLVLVHTPCGAPAEPTLTCGGCGSVLDPRDVAPRGAGVAGRTAARRSA